MEELNLETDCDSIFESVQSNLNVCGGIDETVSLDVGSEFSVEALREMNQPPPTAVAAAAEGGGELNVSSSWDPRNDVKSEEELKGLEGSEVAELATDAGDAPSFSDSKIDERGCEFMVDPQREREVEEEFVEDDVTETGDAWEFDKLEMDMGLDEFAVEGLQLENKVGEEFVVSVDAKVEDVAIDTGGAQPFSNSEMGTRLDEFRGKLVDLDDVGPLPEWLLDASDERVDPVITEEIQTSQVKTEVEVITEVGADVVNVGAGVRDEEHIEDANMSDTKMADGENTSVEVLNDLELGESLAEKENIDTEIKAEVEKETVVMDDKIPDEESRSDVDEEDETVIAEEEETGTHDTDMEIERDVADESGKASGGKRKRGKSCKTLATPKATTKASTRKVVGEDVCFICFDGGDMVLCDRRGCPKAYHPSCVNRDEAFFKAKGQWNCGWHLCSSCEKNARYMCYTCTFSLCKSCIKDAVILRVRGNKGFCETCMKTIMLIENNKHENKDMQNQIDFDDKTSWEFLFKDYYTELKSKLSLTSVEVLEAKNPWKGSDEFSGPSKQESSEAQVDTNDGGSDSDNSVENLEATKRPKRRKLKKQTKSLTKDFSLSDDSEWASTELLEFVSHMKNGDASMIPRYDVQALLLEYTKRNKLRDPRRKSQVICDARLKNLFGKPRVGHFEMLKLLESHFLIKNDQIDDVEGSVVVDTENNYLDVDDNAETKGVKDRKRKIRKKGNGRGPQYNLDDYAAIDMHNISLIYMRRKLMEDLLEDVEEFHDKVIGAFVRIRISGSIQKQELYRLVQIVGTSKAVEPYKVGKQTTDIMVEILNLDKTEVISIDTISNQEFTEEECKRLRQSIKCGLISRLTVGEILDKTMEIQTAKINDWLESETLRLGHLRDRASDMGHRKELRECVEKLQVLKTPEERRRRLEEISEVHSDPKMDPSYESEENDTEIEDNSRDAFRRSRSSSSNNRGRAAPISPGSDNSAKDSWNGSRKVSSGNSTHSGEIVNENSWHLERHKESAQESDNFEKLNPASNSESKTEQRAITSTESRPEPEVSRVSSVVTSQASPPVENTVKITETGKIWHYKDPSGNVQGVFSIVQLRKWNNIGYFPPDLRIWRATEKPEEDSILLSDALKGKFEKELPLPNDNTNNTSVTMTPSNVDQIHMSGSKSSVEQKNAVLPNNNNNMETPTPSSVLNSLVQSGVFSTQGTLMPAQQVQMPAQQQQVAGQIPQGETTTTQSWGNNNGGYPQISNSGPNSNTTGWGVGPANNPNVGWGSNPPQGGAPVNYGPPPPIFPGNGNPGWVGGGAPPPVQGVAPMWGPPSGNTGAPIPAIQGQVPVNGWGPPSGNVSAPPIPVQGNGWGPPGGNVGPMAGNGWGPPGGTAGGAPIPVQGQVTGNGWGPPSGNVGGPGPIPVQGQMNGNGWGPPNNNHQGWGPWSGGGGGGRPWNRQFGGGGGGRGGGFKVRDRKDTLCPYNGNGRCRKGAECNYMHI